MTNKDCDWADVAALETLALTGGIEFDPHGVKSTLDLLGLTDDFDPVFGPVPDRQAIHDHVVIAETRRRDYNDGFENGNKALEIIGNWIDERPGRAIGRFDGEICAEKPNGMVCALRWDEYLKEMIVVCVAENYNFLAKKLETRNY